MFEVGAELAPWTVARVEESTIRSFAKVLDDPNPIHLDPDAVRAMGLGDRVISQGPVGIGYVINMLRSSFARAEIVELELALTSIVFGGDGVEVGGRIEAIESDGAMYRVRCSVWLESTQQTRAVTGTATILTPKSST